MNENTVNLVLCTDDNFAEPTLAAIDSVLESNTNAFLNVFIVTSGLNEQNKSKISEFFSERKGRAEFSLKTADNAFLGSLPVKKGDHVSSAAYLRILLPSILPQNISKVLYIDGDILCVSSLLDFYKTDLSEKSCAAVRDERNDDNEIFMRLAYPKSCGYFNSGILLINLDFWRKNNVQKKALNFIFENPEKCLWHDQDALNKVLAGTVLFSPFRYNLTQGFLFDKSSLKISSDYWTEIDSAVKNPCLIHYSAAYKPWHAECNSPFKKLWRESYEKTFGKKCRLKFKNKGAARVKWLVKFVLNSLHIKKYADFRKSVVEIANEEKSE